MNLLIPEGHNLVVYYILPMSGVNLHNFGRKFINAYINDAGTQVFVELSAPMISKTYTGLNTYIATVNIGPSTIISFSIPREFHEDIQLFKKGLYSKINRATKRLIYQTSGLPYNETMDSFSTSHPVLHALSSSKRLKYFLIEHLKVYELATTGELIDPPDPSWYIENRIKEITNAKQKVSERQ